MTVRRPVLTVDLEADAAYLHLRPASITATRDTGGGVLVDVDRSGRVVGVEVLALSHRAELR